ncbi:autotransporter [Bordetella avium]|uniref:autotransporter n=1 Tax=Bordetella avium TaxID=521 RepID=UPI0011C418E3|nr:autotransporter [Bordetella avium]
MAITNSTLTGAAAGAGGSVSPHGGGGAAGHGGGSVFGGISTGGAAGYSKSSSSSPSSSSSSSSSANGGNGGNVSANTIAITNSTLTGAAAGAGGSVFLFGPSASAYVYGGGGAAGHGGGSVFGGISTGGAAGYSEAASSFAAAASSSANGGDGGAVSANTIAITNSTLTGAAAGAGGSVTSSAYAYGGGGAAGHGGGSVFGGISTGGAAGHSRSNASSSAHSSANGGNGGAVSANTIKITNATLTGAAAGAGGSVSSTYVSASAYVYGGGGAAGHGGGSVFGGISTGGAAGNSSSSSSLSSSSANGGNGGNVSANTIAITNSTLTGAAAGAGGSITSSSSSGYGGGGAAGHGGGSVFGGISTGGAAGYADSFGSATSSSANGGHGGDVTDNKITISGVSKISGDIYGGISQGGAKGKVRSSTTITDGIDGQGGLVQNNTITLIGKDITIGGSIYGGRSINGAGVDDHTRAFTGNTLNLEGYKGSVQGIYNIEKFNWVLPKDVVNGVIMVNIAGNTPVQLDNTKHTAAMYNDGNRLNTGDKITLIDKVQGTPSFASNQTVKQGHFILYDANLAVEANKLVLTIAQDGKGDGTGTAGRINPTAKAFLEGRASSAALANQGADMVSDNAMAAARVSAGGGNAGMFMGSAGGSNRYKTGSHIDVRDINLALGVSKGLSWKGSSAVTLGAFVEYGQGNYDTYNDFGALGEVRGHGHSNFYGIGVLMHIAGLGLQHATDAKLGTQTGPYLQSALRAGRIKNTFNSADLDDGTGVQGSYTSRTSYFSAMAGAGYVVYLNEQSSVDLYSRYTWGKLGANSVMVGNSALEFGASQSSRLRLGARYSHISSGTFTPYVGLAAEREFKGDSSGSSSGLDIAQPSLKGNTGIVEVGASMKPWASKQALSLDMGLQGYVGKREGASGSVKIKYAF